MIGQTLLHYRITDRLGAGGMGEVYRATDTNLGRDVAIKVLPPEVAQDEERLGRFRREAHLLASLNHPNIATIHGLEEANGQPFLVLELVEGEELKARIDRAAIPPDEALEIARQIAEALEEAHSHGIVHRDLKPANVKFAPEGKVKVLDFGLAKALAGETGSGTSSLDLSASPTLAQSGTQAGVILGTAAYMSPEQAVGKTVDKRADIWSFGVVLFEMLTGRPLFTGETASEILASVIKEEPQWDRLPEGCPPPVAHLLRRCLKKRPRERLRDIGDARLEVEDALSGTTEEFGRGTLESGAPTEEVRRARTQSRVAWAAALILGGLAAFFAWPGSTVPEEPRPAIRFGLDLPRDITLTEGQFPEVSPDGQQIAFTAEGPEGRALYLRSFDSRAVRRLSGTEGAQGLLWSPDSASIAFYTQRGSDVTLRRVTVASGAVQTLCTYQATLTFFYAGSWSAEGEIFLAYGPPFQLYRVSASGGEPRLLMEPDEAEGDRQSLSPQLLPDGRGLLYTNLSPDNADRAGIWITSLDRLEERHLVLPGVVYARYSAGHLLHVIDGTLQARPFDPSQEAPAGEPSVVTSSVEVAGGLVQYDIGSFSVSPGGVLAYVEGGSLSQLTWFDREGARLGTLGSPERYSQIQLSPDGQHVAAQIAADIWILDVRRGVATRVTSDPGADVDAVWSPDGRELFFSSSRGEGGVYRLYRKRLGGSGAASLVLDLAESGWSEAVSPDGTSLLYATEGGGTNGSVWAAPLEGPGEPELLMEVEHAIDEPQVSPDGRWLLYGSTDSGSWEVYLAPFRREGERIRVSTEGGRQGKWRSDGREIFYVTPEGQLMAVGVKETNGRLELGLPEPLFDAGVSSPIFDEYAATEDGQRFLVITPAEGEAPRSLQVVVNWPGLLE